MKRLLAYLFIVIGLGLFFNSKSFSISFHDIESLKIGVIQKKTDKFKYNFASSSYKIGKFDKIGYYAGRVKIKKNGDLKGKIFFFPHKGYINPQSYECSLKTKLKNSDSGDIYLRCVNGWYKGNFINDNLKFQTTSVKLLDTNSGFENFFIENLKLNFIPNYKDLKSTRDSFLNTKTQIAKAEPSQTQKVAKIEYSDNNLNIVFCKEPFGGVGSQASKFYIRAHLNKNCKDDYENVSYEFFLDWSNTNSGWGKQTLCYNKKTKNKNLIFLQTRYTCEKLGKDYVKIIHKGGFLYAKDNKFIIKTQIAKTEPSQTQKVAKKKELDDLDKIAALIDKAKEESLTVEEQVVKTSNKSSLTLSEEDELKAQVFGCWSIPLGLPYNEDLRVRIKLKLNPDGSVAKTEILDHARMNQPGQRFYKVLAESALRAIKLCQPLRVPSTGYERWKTLTLNFDAREMLDGGFSSDTQIAKTETTVKPKKKVKVAKVEEPKQEEFKPKKTNQDNEAPVITIAEAITVNDYDYEFEGTVTDKSKQIFIEVDGRLVNVKKGKFTVKGYSPVDKEISIQAIDGYGNRSKPKIVNLIIDIKDTDIAEKLEPLNPSKIRAKISKNKVALIIGIENYIEAPNANYANLDAKYFFDYARKGFGIKKQNINLLVDENATFVKTSKALTLWLKTKIKADQTDLVVFFAGHGLASSDGKELYLLPQDSDPNLLDITALSRTKLFQTIIDLKPKSVTMFLDTCYSGVSRDEQMLLASARPIRIVADEQEGIPDNFTIFTASQVEQISSGLKEANHGIFSYYLMKGLEGNADSNQDNKITNGELLAYMDENVSQKAAEQGRQQNPSLAGDLNKVLISYR